MEMINKTTDFRNWEVFLVKGDEDIIREHFNNQYPQNDIAVLEHLNNPGTFEITLLPKEN
jgi:predicted helicase